MHRFCRIITTAKYVRGFRAISLRYVKPLNLRELTKFVDREIPLLKNEKITSNNYSKANFGSISEQGDIISIKINNATYKFPSIWLRDNCQCPDCFRKESQSRTIDWEKFDFGVKPIDVQWSEENLEIKWSDDHNSSFALDWLKERLFTEEKRKLFRDQVYRFKRVTWGANEFNNYLKKFDYQNVLHVDSVLLNWLESLTTYGVAIISNVPATRNSNKILTERVAFPRKTHYGEEFIVQAKDDATNVAYLSSTLPLHTDLPYYHYAPGVNLLHCVVQSQGKGGDSQLVDTFHVANYLKQYHPKEYKILTKTLVDWNDIGQEDGDHFHSLYQSPVLCEDEFGDLARVNFSQPQRDSHFNSPIEQITPWYEAAGLFTKLLYSPENFVTFKLAEGEILTFDNHRLVHGRSSYSNTAGRERLLVGCYLDWDEIYSRIRVLKKQLENKD